MAELSQQPDRHHWLTAFQLSESRPVGKMGTIFGLLAFQHVTMMTAISTRMKDREPKTAYNTRFVTVNLCISFEREKSCRMA